MSLQECYLYKKLNQDKVQCQGCAHQCILSPGQRGICGVRENQNGKLYSLVYGKLAAINIDPIEKKPLYHFFPGTNALSIGTVGCQFKCQSCQNWQLSQKVKEDQQIVGREISPSELVQQALDKEIKIIAYTYNDPIVFNNYALDVMKLAAEKDIKNVWVTAGFMTEEALDLVAPYMDAANVDFKSYSDQFYQQYCGGKLQPVLNTMKRMKQKDIWLEVTTLIIPGLNDSEENLKQMAKFIKEQLGADTPWHLSRFSNVYSWKLKNISPTPVKTLEKAYQIGKEAGLNYVYIGNVPGNDKQNTYCPQCGELVIGREGFSVTRHDIQGKCPHCNYQLKIIE